MKEKHQSRWLTRLLGVLLLIILVVIAIVGKTMYDFRSDLKPIIDGAELTGGARTVKDDFSAVFVLPAGNNEIALIDCGTDTKGSAILNELHRRKLDEYSIKAIFLTHAHPDHIAGCHLFPEATIYAFEAEAKIASGETRAHGPLPWLIGTPVDHRVKVTHFLKDGESVAIGLLQVTPYLVKGHSEGNAVFLVNGTLYAGDSFTVRKNDSLEPAPWIFSDSVAVANTSLKALAKRLQADHADVKMLAPSHSEAVMGIQTLLDFSRQQK